MKPAQYGQSDFIVLKMRFILVLKAKLRIYIIYL